MAEQSLTVFGSAFSLPAIDKYPLYNRSKFLPHKSPVICVIRSRLRRGWGLSQTSNLYEVSENQIQIFPLASTYTLR